MLLDQRIKEREHGEMGGGSDYFKYFHQRGAIIRGRRLIEGRLLARKYGMFALAPQNSLIWAPPVKYFAGLFNNLSELCPLRSLLHETGCKSKWRFTTYRKDYLFSVLCDMKTTRYSMSGKPHIGNWNWLFSHIEHHIRVTAGRSRGLGTKSTSEYLLSCQ